MIKQSETPKAEKFAVWIIGTRTNFSQLPL